MSADGWRLKIQGLREATTFKQAVKVFKTSKDASDAQPSKEALGKARGEIIQMTSVHALLRQEGGDFNEAFSPDPKARRDQASALNGLLQNTVPELRGVWPKVRNIPSKVYRVAAHYPEALETFAHGDVSGFDAMLEALNKKTLAERVLALCRKSHDAGESWPDVLAALDMVRDALAPEVQSTDDDTIETPQEVAA